MHLLPALSLGLPLLLALALGSRLRPIAQALIPLVALPALALPAFPGLEMELPWLLLGTRLGVDETNIPFLLLMGLLWTAAGVYAHGYLIDDPERARFQFFYLFTYMGNLGTFLALDAASFYLFFTLMTFAAYGLIVHDGSEEARRAGRVYLILGVIGEVLLLVVLMHLGAALGNPDLRQVGPWLAALPDRDLIIGLVLVGFSIKMGVVPLHVWLALAHPCAPTPASAMLSGIIIKAGLMGWLRFLPLGEMALTQWGVVCLSIGMVSAFYGVLMGIPQKQVKTVLAYSSISQMGLVTSLIGIGLAAPETWPFVLAIILLFSLHHGLAKASLFLGVGVTAKAGQWSGWGLVLPALVLAGAPLTSGALAKLLLKDAAYLAPGPWADWLTTLLPLSSGATALLMARFLYLAWPHRRTGTVSAWLWLPWLSLIIAGTILPWWWAGRHFPEAILRVFASELVIEALWIILGAAVLAVTAWGSWRAEGFHVHLPAGDILHPLSRLVNVLPRSGWPAGIGARLILPFKQLGRAAVWLQESDRRLRLWNVTGILFLLLTAGLIALLWRG